MKILIAEDDLMSRTILENALTKWGYSITSACDGAQAWDILRQDGAPRLVILDWMMPHLDGLSVCRNVRAAKTPIQPYLLIVTQKDGTASIVEGLQAGANDYIVKPYNFDELHARVQVGERVLGLQFELADRIRDLENSLAHIKQLQGLLPICAHCKKIRDDQDYWHSVEAYLRHNSELQFTHTICPDCFAKVCAEMKIKTPGKY